MKTNLLVIYGGKSAEHDISLISAKNIIAALDQEKYNLILVGIDRDGTWYQQRLPSKDEPLVIDSDPSHEVVLHSRHNQAYLTVLEKNQSTAINVVFPVLHGTQGEDGTVQGLCRMASVAFVGADVMSTANCMDKDVMKMLFLQNNLPTCEYIAVKKSQRNQINLDEVIATLQLPCFVKPANLGSSVGISKAKTLPELKTAIDEAFKYDNKIIIEKNIVGREIECAVIGNGLGDIQHAALGEIIPNHEFYSYEAKYLDDNGAQLIVPANLDDQVAEKIYQVVLAAYQCLECSGMARVDCFLTANDDIYINEINTIPGFTKISMFPRLWNEVGVSYPDLVQKLIDLALKRFDDQQSLQTTFPGHG